MQQHSFTEGKCREREPEKSGMSSGNLEEQILFLETVFLILFSILPSIVISILIKKIFNSEQTKIQLLKMVPIVSFSSSVLFILVSFATMMAILLNYDQFTCILTAFSVYTIGFLALSYSAMILSITDGKIRKSEPKYSIES